ncbi:putative cyclin-A3-1 [Rosa sericea]
MALTTVAEKCEAPITRAAAKRRAQAVFVEDKQWATKKRAVLGELTRLTNAVDNVIGLVNNIRGVAPPQKPKLETKKKAVKAARDDEDPQLCGAYAADIYAYLRRMEVEPKRRPLPDYMEKIQKDSINANMRGVLVDWLVEVADEYELLPETLHLAVSYVDKYLSMNVVLRSELQLVGVASIFIASKYEEIDPPNVDELSDITENTFTKQQVIKMEADILLSLKFEMGNPNVRTFLRKFIDLAQESYYKNPNMQFESLIYYLTDLSLVDYKLVKFLPSIIAASAVFLARVIITRSKMNPWCPALQEYTGYKTVDLRECVLIIHDLYLGRRGGSLVAVRDKYKQTKLKCVAKMHCPSQLPHSLFEAVKA